MNQTLMAIAFVALLGTNQNSKARAQPVCADSDPVSNKLCLTLMLEELLRRNRPAFDTEYPVEPPLRNRIPPELYDNNVPLVDRGTKRQDVDHVFLRFGR